MPKGFLYILFSHTDFFLKILIFFVIHTDFVLDQSGRSLWRLVPPKNETFPSEQGLAQTRRISIKVLEN